MIQESISHLSSQALNADNVPLFVEKCVEFLEKNGETYFDFIVCVVSAST